MEINAFVIKIYMEIIVSLALLLEHGITQKTNVFVQPLKQFGMEVHVNVPQELMVIIAKLAHHLDIGILIKINVFAEVHWFGMDQTVHVLNLTLWIKEIV